MKKSFLHFFVLTLFVTGSFFFFIQNTKALTEEGKQFNIQSNSISALDNLVNPKTFEGVPEGKNQQPLSKILNQLFFIGLVITIILAIIMIIVGGIQYMTIDAMASKESGKKRVQAALGGLVLAFSAILILNTINPNITSLRIVFPKLKEIKEIEIDGVATKDINDSLAKSSKLTDQQLAEILASGKIPKNISPTAQKILAQTFAELNKMNTGELDNTQGGYLACAAAVNKIIELATGQPAGGGVSTALLQKSLAESSRFVQVPGGLANSLPGDIVISPTKKPEPGKYGHTGIVVQPGGASIVSNSSTNKTIQENYDAEKWLNRFSTERNLEVLVYRPL